MSSGRDGLQFKMAVFVQVANLFMQPEQSNNHKCIIRSCKLIAGRSEVSESCKARTHLRSHICWRLETSTHFEGVFFSNIMWVKSLEFQPVHGLRALGRTNAQSRNASLTHASHLSSTSTPPPPHLAFFGEHGECHAAGSFLLTCWL